MWVMPELRVLLFVLTTLMTQILSLIPPIRKRMVAVITERAHNMLSYCDNDWQVSAAGGVSILNRL